MNTIGGAASLEPQADSAQQPLALTAAEFAMVAALARQEFGLELGDGKQQLVAARLAKLMRRRGFASFREYYRSLQNDGTGEAQLELIDALATHHTGFFREQAHFDFLVHRVFSQWERSHPLRIWSAACATGEEPYTIALTAREHFGSDGVRLPQILASDISTRTLETARKGMYRADRFQEGLVQGGLPPWLHKHLLRGEGGWQGWYRMRSEIRAMVEFRRINLIDPLPAIGRFTVIFCRNVMIYFHPQTQERVVNRLTACLHPGGYLFVGHAESLTGMQHGLEQVQPAIYRLRGGK